MLNPVAFSCYKNLNLQKCEDSERTESRKPGKQTKGGFELARQKDENREKPERLAELENVLSGAPQAENTQTEEVQDGILQSFKNKVMAAEDDIEKYCNDKFLLFVLFPVPFDK